MRRPPITTLFPSTTLFRSEQRERRAHRPPPLDRRRLHGALVLVEEADDRCERRQQGRSEEHTSELQSRQYLVCRLLLETKINYSHADICYAVFCVNKSNQN